MDFDLILEEIGEFGKFQLTNYLLICLPVLYGAANSLSYVFTARTPSYRFLLTTTCVAAEDSIFKIINFRCLVPECESLEDTQYNVDWMKDVLPPEICSKYVFNDQNVTQSNETCARQWFTDRKERCYAWVFDENERTIVNDVS